METDGTLPYQAIYPQFAIESESTPTPMENIRAFFLQHVIDNDGLKTIMDKINIQPTFNEVANEQLRKCDFYLVCLGR